jgi:importin subunit alpha-1
MSTEEQSVHTQKKVGAKTTIDVSEGTKRRHEEAASIRSRLRERQMKIHRGEGDSDDDNNNNGNNNNNNNGGWNNNNNNNNNGNGNGSNDNNNNNGGPNLDPFFYTVKSPPSSIPLQLLPQFRSMLTADDPRVVLHGTMMIRKILAVKSNPPIEDVIHSGAVPDLVRLLGRTDDFNIMYEACWAVSNIVSGTEADARYVIELNAVPPIIVQLSCPSDTVREQAAWAIGNLAGESVAVRDMLLHNHGAMQALLYCINMQTEKVAVTRNAVWAVSNLCRHRPAPDLNTVSGALPVLSSLLNHYDDDVICDALWTISYIGEGNPDRVQQVILSGVIPKVVGFLSHTNWLFQLPAIRIIGNLAGGTKQQNQIVFSSGATSVFHFLIGHPRRSIRKEVVWCVGNLLVGEDDQVQQVFETKIMPDCIKVLRDNDVMLRLEGVYTLQNALNRGTPQQVDFLVANGLLKNLVLLLADPSTQVICGTLEALNSLFQCGDELREATGAPSNIYCVSFVELGGLSKLEALSEHTDNDVYEMAFEFGNEYFPDSFASTGGSGGGNDDDNNSGGWGGGGASSGNNNNSGWGNNSNNNNNFNNGNNHNNNNGGNGYQL